MSKKEKKNKSKKKKGPPLKLVLQILRKYRKKNSFIFFLKWGVFCREKPQGKIVPSLLDLLYLWNEDTQQLWSLYVGLSQEIGQRRALQAVWDLSHAADRAKALELKEKHMRELRKKYGKKIPEKFLLTPAERTQRYKKIKKIRAKKKK